MDRPSLYIVKQNYLSVCFKCGVEKIFFTVYKCGKCEPQTVEKYCYECCEKSLLKDDDNITALCMGCAFCYDYVHVSSFYKKQKKGGWQGLKFDCSYCACCCGGGGCVTGSLCCCISEDEDEKKKDLEKDTDEDPKTIRQKK